MKILRIRVDGLPLYKEPFDISFLAVQRVQNTHMDSLFNLFGNVYINTAEAFVGINASGKTTALNVISFTNALLSAVPLSSEFVPNILFDTRTAVFDIYFYADEKIFYLSCKIRKSRRPDGSECITIIDERLWSKPANSKVNKANLLDFEGKEPIRVRNNSDEYLSDDVSIMIAINKQTKDNTLFVDLSNFTNFNLFIPSAGYVPAEIITLLDPTIEYISTESINNKVIARLKFYGSDEMVLFNPSELNAYLSSGTIKGIRVFMDAINILENGGYMIVDEIENHFNRELVVCLMRLFLNKRTNRKGAVIVFSTHYPDLLDELDRNDAVFITKNDSGMTIDNLNSLLSRNDLKKSEVYQSNFVGGTAPKYKSLMALEKSIIKNMEA